MVTVAFTILTSSAAAAASVDDEEYQNFGTFIADKLQNYLLHTRNKEQHTISHIMFAANQGHFDVSYPVSVPSKASQVASPTTSPSAAGSEDIIMSEL